MQRPKINYGGEYGTLGYPKDRKVYGYGGSIVDNSIYRRELGIRFLSGESFIIPVGCDALLSLRQTNKLEKNLVNDKLIHIISDVNVLVLAYELIKSNPGNMTLGSSRETLDGLDLQWFDNISKDLKAGKFQFSPARRKMIPKPGKIPKRPLGIVNPRDKVVQKAMQLVLESIYEPSFLVNSHGFRPGKGTHTALYQAKNLFQGVHWVIEADFSKCFENIDHSILLNLLGKRIRCGKTLALVKRSLEAGYTNLGEFVITKLGTPQGSVLSPLLCNIFLHELDVFMRHLKLSLDRGKQGRVNPDYKKVWRQLQKASDPASKRELRQKLWSFPSKLTMDPSLRRLHYVRYADDFIVGFIGPHSEAVEIKNQIDSFLVSQLQLKLNLEKSKITHFKKSTFTFLGTVFKSNHLKEKWVKTVKRGDVTRKIRVTLPVRLLAPINNLMEKAMNNGFLRKTDGIYKPTSLGRVMNLDHADIVRYYNQVIRGIVNYYSFVDNLSKLRLLIIYLRHSCALTLRKKYKEQFVSTVFRRFGTNCTCPDSKISLFDPICRRTNHFSINPVTPEAVLQKSWSKKLTRSNFNKTCLVCGSSSVEMHHVRQIRDLKNKEKAGTFDFWTLQLAAINRKQIPLCRLHHESLHKNTLSKEERTQLQVGIQKFVKN